MQQNGVKDNEFCIVIKTHKRDALDFLQLLQDLERVSDHPLFVTVPQDQFTYFARITPSYVTILGDNEILAAYGIRRNVKDSWGSQQLLKLLCVGFLDYGACLLLDANSMVLSRLEQGLFMHNGRYCYDLDDCPSIEDRLWQMTSHKFLSLPPQAPHFRPVNQVLLKKNLLALFAYLEQWYQTNVASLLLAACELSGIWLYQLWTECTLYGAYIASLIDKGGHVFDRKLHVIYYFHDI